MSIFVYILELDGKRYYTGITKNIKQRYNQHLSRSSKSTKSYLNMRLIYTNKYNSYSEARRQEINIKNIGARRFLNKLKWCS